MWKVTGGARAGLFYPAGNKSLTADFRQFRSDCGDPDYPSVIGNVPRLEELFPLKHGRESLPKSVSRSTVSQFFTGSKQALPSAGILAVLILSHLRCAAENGSIRTDPDTDAPQGWEAILEAWQARLRQAKRENEPDPPLPDHSGGQSGGTVAAGPWSPQPGDSSASGAGEEATELLVMPSVSLAKPPGIARLADPVRLEPGELAALVGLGAYGTVLAESAATGDREAIFQLAVALALHPEYRARAEAYLVNATAAGHPAAAGLVPDPGQGIDPWHARALAQKLAETAEARGHEAAQCLFRTCVLQAGLRNLPVAVDGDELR